jgi:hypothetical protein
MLPVACSVEWYHEELIKDAEGGGRGLIRGTKYICCQVQEHKKILKQLFSKMAEYAK